MRPVTRSSRSLTAILAAFALVPLLAVGCRKQPPEPINSHDGGTHSTEVASKTDAAPSPSDSADAGRSETATFCGDIYAADNAHLAERCLMKDIAVAQGLAHAAGTLCADDMKAAVARDRVAFDRDAAKQCIKMLENNTAPRSSNADTLFTHEPCDEVLLGLQAEGDPCRFSVECKSGLACVGYAQGADGTCKKPPKIGQECIAQRFGTILSEVSAQKHHPDCAAGAYCEGKTCAAQLPAGKPCVAPLACSGGMACVMGVCAKSSGDGGGCFTSSDCVYGDWCDRSSGAPQGKCAPKRRAGAECPLADACKGRCDTPPGGDAGAGKVGHCVDVCNSG